MTVVIDASVWIAARFEDEPGHEASTSCLAAALSSREPIVEPWLAWVECVAAVARKTGNEKLATDVGGHLRGNHRIRWDVMDEERASLAAGLAASCRLRAADAMYAAVAARHRAFLVTLDAEMQARCAGHVPCLSPSGWLQTQS
jgi:predicted nucleic acid-binding protein